MTNLPGAVFSPNLELALRFAALAHVDQRRKDTKVPYITHPMQVAWLLQRAGFTDEDVLAAALLHDVVEDCEVSLAQLRDEFSPAVADLVAALSERKRDVQGQKRSWEDRKREHLEHLAAAAPGAKAIALADKLHNLATIRLDLQAGQDVWSRFNAPRERLLDYYSRVIAACEDRTDPRNARLADACRAEVNELTAIAT